MRREPNKRPRRNPLSSEEVANFIAHRKRREQVKLEKFRRSRVFRVLNVYVIACIFLYLELLLCYFGPAHYQRHYSFNVIPSYGHSFKNGKLLIEEMDLYGVNSKIYKLVINDVIEIPHKRTSFLVGKDFILQKRLKASLENSDATYRLFSASPVLFLCIFISFMSAFAYIYNLNENMYSLSGLAAANTLVLLAIILIG